MLRTALRQAGVAASRRAQVASAARPAFAAPLWGARYNSTGPKIIPETEQKKENKVTGEAAKKEQEMKKGEAAPGVNASTTVGPTTDKEVDAALNEALIQALEEIQLEANVDETPLTVQGYDGPILENLPSTPNPRFPLSSLPLPALPAGSAPPTCEETYHATLTHGRSLLPPLLPTPTYRIPIASLHLRSFSPSALAFFSHFALHAAASLGIPASRPVCLPTQRSLWTVLRGPFAHKKSQENFERRTHKRCIKVWDADEEVVRVWAAYLRKHAMGGVGMRVTRWERRGVDGGLGRVRERVGEEVRKANEVRRVAEGIAKRELEAGKEGAGKEKEKVKEEMGVAEEAKGIEMVEKAKL